MAIDHYGSRRREAEMDHLAGQRCATSLWYPAIDCLGSPYLVRWGHPVLGERWACLEHAVHAIGRIPDSLIIESPDPFFADEIRSRALAL